MTGKLEFNQGAVKYTYKDYPSCQLESVELNKVEEGDMRVIMENIFYARSVYPEQIGKNSFIKESKYRYRISWSLVSLLKPDLKGKETYGDATSRIRKDFRTLLLNRIL